MTRRLRTATRADVAALRLALDLNRAAVTAARAGGAAPRTVARLRAAGNSLGGAVRHAERAAFRWECPACRGDSLSEPCPVCRGAGTVTDAEHDAYRASVVEGVGR